MEMAELDGPKVRQLVSASSHLIRDVVISIKIKWPGYIVSMFDEHCLFNGRDDAASAF